MLAVGTGLYHRSARERCIRPGHPRSYSLLFSRPVNPDVESAIERLERECVLSSERARPLARAARGELISLWAELRVALYAGVILIVTGAGLLIRQNLDRIGPLAIAVGLGAAAVGCLAWVVARAPAFSWGEVPSPDLAFDYVLLLGALLAATDLAYIEVKFTALGASWPLHLLLVAVFYAVLAFRFDSRVQWSLALTTLAAWRGVSVRFLDREPWNWWGDPVVRANAIACGLAFALVGWLLARYRRKAHFEPVAVNLGWLLVLGGLASGALQGSSQSGWAAFSLLLLAVAIGVAAVAFAGGRLVLFAMGCVGAYAAISRLVVETLHGDQAVFAWFSLSAIAAVVGLVAAQRRMKGRA